MCLPWRYWQKKEWIWERSWGSVWLVLPVSRKNHSQPLDVCKIWSMTLKPQHSKYVNRVRCVVCLSLRYRSLKSWGAECRIQTFHSSGRNSGFLPTVWHCIRDRIMVSMSLLFLFPYGYFLFHLMCRNLAASFWISCRGKLLCLYSCTFSVSVGGWEFRSLLCRHLRWPLKSYVIFFLSFFFQSAKHHLSIGEFNPFSFNVVVDMIELKFSTYICFLSNQSLLCSYTPSFFILEDLFLIIFLIEVSFYLCLCLLRFAPQVTMWCWKSSLPSNDIIWLPK